MDWKKDKLKSIWKLNKEKLIFLFCAGMLLFLVSLPAEGNGAGADGSEAGAAGIGSGGAKADGAGADWIGTSWGSSARDSAPDMGRTRSGAGGREGQDGGSGVSPSYEEELEARIGRLLSQVEGVGEADVMVVLKSSEERVYRVDQNQMVSQLDGNEDSQGEKRQELSESTVLAGQDQEPVVEKELRPEISGIVISAEGGGSAVVRAEVSEAMEALFGLPQHKIKVLKRVKEGV